MMALPPLGYEDHTYVSRKRLLGLLEMMEGAFSKNIASDDIENDIKALRQEHEEMGVENPHISTLLERIISDLQKFEPGKNPSDLLKDIAELKSLLKE